MNPNKQYSYKIIDSDGTTVILKTDDRNDAITHFCSFWQTKEQKVMLIATDEDGMELLYGPATWGWSRKYN